MKTIAIIPTYNESENIEGIAKEVLNLPLNIDVLVVDDNSPDKTYETGYRARIICPIP